MKIFYTSLANIPSKTASSIHIIRMCNWMSKLGHEVILFVPYFKGNKLSNKDISRFYGININFKIVQKFKLLKIYGGKHIFALLSLYYLRMKKVDLVYARFLHSAFYFAAFGIRTIFESHKPYQSYGNIEKFLLRRLLNNKNLVKVVVISNALKERFLNGYNNFPVEKMVVEHDAADLPSIHDQKTNCRIKGKLNIAYIGSLYTGRGVDLILNIASKLDDTYFHIIGGNEDEIEFWKNKNTNENVYFHGFLNQIEIQKRIESFDVLIAPYQKQVAIAGSNDTNTVEWMSPLKIFEYMSYNKAIITSSLPVLYEVLNENNSIMVDPEDDLAWIRAIEKLKNGKLREKLSSNAFRDFSAFYTWEKRVNRIISDFDS